MSVDPITFGQIAHLDTKTVKELVETVILAIRMNPELARLPREKLMIAFELISCIANLFESCGCTVTTMIENPNWRNPLGYKTGLGGGELTDKLDETMDDLDNIMGGQSE